MTPGHNPTVFRLEVRVVACEFCGAPLEVGVAGGSLPCKFCGSLQQIVPRSDHRLWAEVQVSEPERLARLAYQDVKLPRPAGQAAVIMPGGFLLPWKVPEAMALWQQTSAECRVAQDFVQADTVVALAIGLGAHLEDHGEALQSRAILESSLDVVRHPRHLQMLRCALARSACRSGDLRAAEAWFAPCDPRSQDLASDST
jgi:hypothetical protein